MDHIMFPQDDDFRRLTDYELDLMFPEEGYKVFEPPCSNVPITTPFEKCLHSILEENMLQKPDGLFLMKPDDYQYFGSLLNKEYEEYEEELSQDEKKGRDIMKLLLMVKNGDPSERETGLCQFNEKAREFGAGPLFNCILPLIMMYTLEEHDRQMLVKVINIVLYKLDELVQPYVRKMLVLIRPLLIDEKFYARLEGREIISKYTKAAWLVNIISVVNPDVDNIHEYVSNTIVDAFSVVALALGIPPLLPFLKDLCQSKKQMGIKIVQQIAIQMGCRVFPHLKFLVEIIKHGLIDKNEQVRTITGFTVAALAEASAPFGIESFDSVLKPLWKGILSHRGKDLSAFLKAIGYIITLMNTEYAGLYTKEVMVILIREFQSPDEELKQIVLEVVKQCVSTKGLEADYIRNNIIPEFFKNLWVRRMGLDRRNYKQLIETTVEIANKVGVPDIVARIVEDLKDESEEYRRMAMETFEKVLTNLGASDIDARLEELLIDCIMYTFQEQTSDDDDDDDDDNVMITGFSTVVNSLGQRVKPYLPQICGMIKWRLNNKNAKVRQQAADLISRIAVVMKQCQEEELMGHLGVVLYEYLGEECPDVLGSILGALKAIVNINGMTEDLLSHLSLILNNTNEKVQENCIDLVGHIADIGGDFISEKEWMAICFKLLQMLNSDKKEIRIATMKAFGYIAKAIGPVDVLAILLNNLRSQEADTSVVAIAIIAETCSLVIVLPALMYAYCVPELNLKNNVLKSLSFLFEYIGVTKKDYVYAVTPLLTNALKDRNLLLKQNAASVVKHMALGVAGLGCEDALIHLLNYVWPLIFEISPDRKYVVMEAIDAIGMALGPVVMLNYCLQGLFHPARKVRKVYWEIYNSLYIGSQDALVAAYPMLEDDGENFYSRHELNMFI